MLHRFFVGISSATVSSAIFNVQILFIVVIVILISPLSISGHPFVANVELRGEPATKEAQDSATQEKNHTGQNGLEFCAQ
jgi:hypothetical protein